jgi:hypothetical protein
MEVSMSDSHSEERDGSHGPKTFEIKIDRTSYKVHEPVLTGAQLRALPEPDIGRTVISSKWCRVDLI